MKIVAHCARCGRPADNFAVTYHRRHYRAQRYWLVEAVCHGESDVDSVFERTVNASTDTVTVPLFGERPTLDLTDEDIPF